MESKRHPDFDPARALLLTGGDPAGISPEIIPPAIAAWLRDGPPDAPLVYFATAGPKHLASIEQRFGSQVTIERVNQTDAKSYLDSLNRKDLQETPPPVLTSDPGQTAETRAQKDAFDTTKRRLILFDLYRRSLPGAEDCIRAGEPGPETGRLALTALEEACVWIERMGCLGLATAPLAKSYVDAACRESGHRAFHGHTGFLAERFSSDVVMLMHGKKFSVLPLTTHIALRDVPHRLREVLKSGALMERITELSLLPVFRGRPIALAALNPHAGESGLMGTEELDFVDDWVKKMQSRGVPVEGPLPADGLFIESVRSRFRLILCCYHDQGLIPFKALEGADGINVTIGLPFLRSSPDHGTAFGIAGKGMADPGSMVRALQILWSQELGDG